ncbi:MAG: hypothetical protein RXN84_01400 [Caldivirga sp.]
MTISEEFVNEALMRIKPGEVIILWTNGETSIEFDDVTSIMINVNSDEYSVLRMIAMARAYNDPLIFSKWAITDELSGRRYSRVASLALLSRLIDYILVESGYEDYVTKSFNESGFRRTLINGPSDLKLRALEALGLDVPFSIEMSHRGSGIINDIIKGLGSDFISRYLDLRSYLLNNTSLEYLLNYLDLLFRDS